MASYLENKAFVDSIFPQYPLDEAIDWIQNNLEPEDVFSDEKLKEWAENSGFVKDE